MDSFRWWATGWQSWRAGSDVPDDAGRRRRRVTRPGVGGRQRRRARVHEGAGRCGFGGRQPRSQQGADHAGQHVAGPGGRRPGLPGRVEVDPPAGFGDDGDVALQQHGDPERVGQLAGGADTVVAGRGAGQSGELTGVRRQQGRGATAADHVGVGRQDGQRVGVDQHRQVGAQREPQRGGSGVVGAQARPDDPGLHPPGRGRGGRRDHLGPMRDHLAVRAAGVADHAGGAPRRRRRYTAPRRPDTSTNRPSRRSRPGCTCRRAVRAPASARPRRRLRSPRHRSGVGPNRCRPDARGRNRPARVPV